jgi:hypothetical protein
MRRLMRQYLFAGSRWTCSNGCDDDHVRTQIRAGPAREPMERPDKPIIESDDGFIW